MRTKFLVLSYLKTLETLTNAGQINLSFPNKFDANAPRHIYHQESGLLPEFDPQQTAINFPPSAEQTGAAYYSGLKFFSGSVANSILIHCNLQALEKLTIKPSFNDEQPNRREFIKKNNSNDVSFWLGFTFTETMPIWLSEQIPTSTNHGISENELTTNKSYQLLQLLLTIGGGLVDHIEKSNMLLTDPLTSLPSRVKFQHNLAELCAKYPMVAMLLVNPADFQHINQKFGHDNGDVVISEIADNLSHYLRESDLISRFNSARFAIAVPIKKTDDLKYIVDKLQLKLSDAKYLNGATSLTFHLGGAIMASEQDLKFPTEQAAELIARAELAMYTAQQENDTNYVLWHPKKHEKYQLKHDHIGGIFTADTASDYRNMLLLWDISNIIASYNDFDLLLKKVLKRLAKNFNFNFGGILQCNNTDTFTSKIMFKVAGEGEANQVASPPHALLTDLIQVAGKPSQLIATHKLVKDQHLILMAPFNERLQGAFYLIGEPCKLKLTVDSQLLLTALAKQVGRAFARASMEEQLKQQLSSQKQKLQIALDELKQTVQTSNVYYRSTVMQKLMKQAQRASLTDTTTLVIGESGTGKERLVHAIHQMGNKADKPLVIVDCSAIPETLIESELFGHSKGAFTGAQNDSKGRILESAGGTLMLDEIGELPLLVQSKLLRFVQEKQFTPVGGSKAIKVEVKIIAVTNRELQEEVNQGRFRQDLFYRLNVLVLRTPPLRDRFGDITLLSKHFLKKFSIQFDEPQKHISAQANKAMQDYSWPGNVRELENKLMQAMLFCDESQIELTDLNLTESITSPSHVVNQPMLTASSHLLANAPEPLITPDNASTKSIAAISTSPSFLVEIKVILTQHIDHVLQHSLALRAPIGQWLEDDLIIATYNKVDKNARQASLRLGVAHSTLRRKVEKISRQNSVASKQRTPEWTLVLEALQPVVEGNIWLGDDCLKCFKDIILSIVIEKVPENTKLASALLGISEPTFHKWKNELVQKI